MTTTTTATTATVPSTRKNSSKKTELDCYSRISILSCPIQPFQRCIHAEKPALTIISPVTATSTKSMIVTNEAPAAAARPSSSPLPVLTSPKPSALAARPERHLFPFPSPSPAVPTLSPSWDTDATITPCRLPPSAYPNPNSARSEITSRISTSRTRRRFVKQDSEPIPHNTLSSCIQSNNAINSPSGSENRRLIFPSFWKSVQTTTNSNSNSPHHTPHSLSHSNLGRLHWIMVEKELPPQHRFRPWNHTDNLFGGKDDRYTIRTTNSSEWETHVGSSVGPPLCAGHPPPPSTTDCSLPWPLAWSQHGLPLLPSPLQRLHKHKGVYPLVQPISILRNNGRFVSVPDDKTIKSSATTTTTTATHEEERSAHKSPDSPVPMSLPSYSLLHDCSNSICTNNNFRDGCSKKTHDSELLRSTTTSTSTNTTPSNDSRAEAAMQNGSYTPDFDTKGNSHNSIKSNDGNWTPPLSVSNRLPEAATDEVYNSDNNKSVHFDPRITVTELADHEHVRIWYDDSEISRFRTETIERARRYLIRHPDQIALFRDPILDPITKTERRRPLYVLPALSSVTQSDDGDSIGNADELERDFLTTLVAFDTADDEQCEFGASDATSNVRNGSSLETIIRRVLIVDSNPKILDLMNRSLHTMFHRATARNIDIRCAPTPEAALQLIQISKSQQNFSTGAENREDQPPFDVIICEELHPSMASQEKASNGTIAAINNQSTNASFASSASPYQSIRAFFSTVPSKDKILLVAVSKGDIQPSTMLRCKAAGADLVWGKPPPRMDSILRRELEHALRSKRCVA